jgi:hypothetical protein
MNVPPTHDGDDDVWVHILNLAMEFRQRSALYKTLMSPGGIFLGLSTKQEMLRVRMTTIAARHATTEASGFLGKSLQVHPKVMRIYLLSGYKTSKPVLVVVGGGGVASLLLLLLFFLLLILDHLGI